MAQPYAVSGTLYELAAGAIADVMRPGQRLDEQTPGYGLGLPIAGGLLATLMLPKARQ